MSNPTAKFYPMIHSSNLFGVAYENDTLYVLFKGGEVTTLYKYDLMPPAVFYGFFTAESAGQYFWKHVRDSYPYTRCTRVDAQQAERELRIQVARYLS